MTSPASPTRLPSRLTHALGASDTRGWLTPVWQSLLVGTVFVAVALAGFHNPHARNVTVDVTGPAPAVRALSMVVGRSHPGEFHFQVQGNRSAGVTRLRSGRTLGVLDLGPQPTLTYAGANGPTVTIALTRSLVSAAAVVTGGRALVTADVLPLRTDDSAGLPLFYLAFGTVLASYLFSITSNVVSGSLTAQGHWTSAAALAVALALIATGIARYGTRSIGSEAPSVALLLMLASLGTSSATWLCLRAFRSFGSIIGTVVLVILGSASGGVLPGPFLPSWLSVLRPALPMGAALGGIRDTTYFGGHHLGSALLVLTAWAVLPVLLARRLQPRAAPAADRRSRTGRAPDAGDPAAQRPA